MSKIPNHKFPAYRQAGKSFTLLNSIPKQPLLQKRLFKKEPEAAVINTDS